MTFEAYLNTIRARTGKGPAEFFEEAVQGGVLTPSTRPMEFVAWLKAHSGLGHGHSMAVWEAFKRNGWVPLAGAANRAATGASKRGRA